MKILGKVPDRRESFRSLRLQVKLVKKDMRVWSQQMYIRINVHSKGSGSLYVYYVFSQTRNNEPDNISESD